MEEGPQVAQHEGPFCKLIDLQPPSQNGREPAATNTASHAMLVQPIVMEERHKQQNWAGQKKTTQYLDRSFTGVFSFFNKWTGQPQSTPYSSFVSPIP